METHPSDFYFDNPYKVYYKKDIKRQRALRLFVKFLYILLVFYFVMLFSHILFNINYRFLTISGPSMQPTLNPNPTEINGVLYQDGVYMKYTQDIAYGDIIIVDREEEKGIKGYTVIKRAMAFGGDKISIAKLPVGENGEFEYRFIRIKAGDEVEDIVYQGQDDEYIIYEDYILGYDDWGELRTNQYNGVEYENDFYVNFIFNNHKEIHLVTVGSQTFQVEFYQVEQGQVFYLGDNRNFSQDSRITGTASMEKVVGKVVAIIRNGNSILGWADTVWEYFVILYNEFIGLFS